MLIRSVAFTLCALLLPARAFAWASISGSTFNPWDSSITVYYSAGTNPMCDTRRIEVDISGSDGFFANYTIWWTSQTNGTDIDYWADTSVKAPVYYYMSVFFDYQEAEECGWPIYSDSASGSAEPGSPLPYSHQPYTSYYDPGGHTCSQPGCTSYLFVRGYQIYDQWGDQFTGNVRVDESIDLGGYCGVGGVVTGHYDITDGSGRFPDTFFNCADIVCGGDYCETYGDQSIWAGGVSIGGHSIVWYPDSVVVNP